MSEENTTEQEATNEEISNTSKPQPENETNPNAEAAKYRTRLREAEATSETLANQLRELQKQHVNLLVSEGHLKHESWQPRLRQPDDLWNLGGHQLEEFLADDGTINTEALAKAAHELLEKRPELKRLSPQRVDPAVSGMPGPMKSNTWQGAFSPRR